MQEIIKISKKQKRLTQPTKSLVVDVYIELKKYKEALSMLKTMKYPSILKEALLFCIQKRLGYSNQKHIKNKV